MSNLRLKFVLIRAIFLSVMVSGVSYLPFLILHQGTAYAGGQVTSRKITLSNSAPSATSVTYAVSFKPATASNIGGIVVDFCANDPLIGDTSCTFPTAFTLGTTVSVSGLAGFSTSTGTWVTTNSLQCGAAASNFQVLLYTNTTAQTPTGTSTAITFNITGVTNTSTNGSFYARILTFDTSAHTTSEYTCSSATARPATFADMIDYGGVALSTNSTITITAKVYETLSFCVFKTSCGTAPALTLGDPTTGALSTSNAYINADGRYTLATNAGSGVNVVMYGQTLCRNSTPSNCLTGASANTISAIGSSPTQVNTGTGTEQFGMCFDVTSGTGGLAAGADYTDSNNNCHGLSTGTYSGTSKFGFDDTAGANGTNGVNGSTVLTSTGAVASITNPFVAAANVAATTEAGVYQSSLQLVATSTF